MLNIFINRKTKAEENELSGDLSDSGFLLNQVSDSGILLDDYDLERRVEDTQICSGDTSIISIPKKSLFNEVKSRFNGIKKKDIEETIEDFMREIVFSSNDFYYEDSGKLGKIINYFDKLNELDLDSNTLQSIESAKTVLLHLGDYLSKESNFGFKSYLFGKTGVLTKKRLDDMNSIKNSLSGYDGKIESKRNYIFSKGDKDNEKFNVFNVSYNCDSGKKFVNINDDNSKGMHTNHGKLYWDSLDKMFEENIDTRKTITKSIKKFMNHSYYFGNLKKIKGYDWKKYKFMDYFKLNV